ncbi:hypothetical protein C8F04DRAFT_1276343 [Mycena alexandri]|uniref:Integrase catalytic domain-containing protein n=1 Tax=Mycena alexandri TaxID=1745969 RepID=A0AAD6S2H0_9AGAR|nr:hypothetical protein C8F04DRAFT_1276343 [Mycena alexandri]
MVNEAGKNGVNNGTKPPDEVLKTTLHDFARRQLSIDDRLAELVRLHGYSIKKSLLKTLNNKFEVPSVRKPPPLPVCTALVAQKMSENNSRRHGPTTIQHQIARETGIPIPRDMVRSIAHTIDPEGAELRFPGKKTPFKVRGQLKAVGPMEEVHLGIPIYGFCDHTGKILHLTVIPNDRKEDAIGHVYLDFVESTGEMPVQLTFDGGNETGLMKALQQELWLLADKLTELDRPSTVTLKSTDNIPIESLWSYWQTYAGQNIKEMILQGNADGLFAPGNPNHVNLFQWLWSRIVQLHLDEFQDHWNTTPRRSQKFKLLPMATPEMIFFYPEQYDMLHCGTTVPAELVKELRATHLNKTRAEVMEWVPQVFDQLVRDTYEYIGSPGLHYTTGWVTLTVSS